MNQFDQLYPDVLPGSQKPLADAVSCSMSKPSCEVLLCKAELVAYHFRVQRGHPFNQLARLVSTEIMGDSLTEGPAQPEHASLA